MKLSLLPGRYGICRLDPAAPLPAWALAGPFWSVTRTADELSVVCDETGIPDGVRHAPGWRCLKVEGPLDFGLTGVLASLAVPLAEAGVSVFVVSTYDTDYLLVKEEDFSEAQRVLEAADHRVGSVLGLPPPPEEGEAA
jgi:hypothetical protein